MPDLNFIRAEIEHMRRQIVRHRKRFRISSARALQPSPQMNCWCGCRLRLTDFAKSATVWLVITAGSIPEQTKSLTGLSSGASVEYVEYWNFRHGNMLKIPHEEVESHCG
jgi:hypothetical protein